MKIKNIFLLALSSRFILSAGSQTATVENKLTTCLPVGCKALLIINDTIKKQLQANDTLDVRFFSAQAQEKEISYSLKGFEKALYAMSQR